MSQALLKALESVQGTGNFHSYGEHDYFPLGLQVEGFGELPFPLHPKLALSRKIPFPAPILTSNLFQPV